MVMLIVIAIAAVVLLASPKLLRSAAARMETETEKARRGVSASGKGPAKFRNQARIIDSFKSRMTEEALNGAIPRTLQDDMENALIASGETRARSHELAEGTVSRMGLVVKPFSKECVLEFVKGRPTGPSLRRMAAWCDAQGLSDEDRVYASFFAYTAEAMQEDTENLGVAEIIAAICPNPDQAVIDKVLGPAPETGANPAPKPAPAAGGEADDDDLETFLKPASVAKLSGVIEFASNSLWQHLREHYHVNEDADDRYVLKLHHVASVLDSAGLLYEERAVDALLREIKDQPFAVSKAVWDKAIIEKYEDCEEHDDEGTGAISLMYASVLHQIAGSLDEDLADFLVKLLVMMNDEVNDVLDGQA